jgi:hypothetical protein
VVAVVGSTTLGGISGLVSNVGERERETDRADGDHAINLGGEEREKKRGQRQRPPTLPYLNTQRSCDV